MTKLDILIFAAHPDDAEIGMGGTIVKHVRAGKRVGICDLTLAEMSSNGTVAIRQAEAEQASRHLGISTRINLALPDRGLFLQQDQIAAMTRVIREHEPSIVFAPYWQDRHPDHVMCSQMAEHAVFNAKLRNYMPEQGLAAVSVKQLVYYFINDVHPAHLAVDISEVYDEKMAALRAYESQFTQASTSNQYVQTPLNQGYLERVEARDRLQGIAVQTAYAEGFIMKQPILVNLIG